MTWKIFPPGTRRSYGRRIFQMIIEVIWECSGDDKPYGSGKFYSVMAAQDYIKSVMDFYKPEFLKVTRIK